MRIIIVGLLFLLFLIPEAAFSGEVKATARFERKALKAAIENMQTAMEHNPDSDKNAYEAEDRLMGLLSSYMRSAGREEARDEAIRLLKSSSPSVRHAAIGILYVDGSKANYPILLQQLHDPDKHVRTGAINALQHTGDRTVIPILIKELKDPGDLIIALGLIGGEAAAGAILEAMKGADQKTIYLASYHLAELGEKKIVPDLINLLKDQDKNICMAAIYVLGKTEDRAAIPALKELLKEEDKKMRFMTAYALGRLGEQHAAPYLLEAIMEDKDDSDKRLGKLDYAVALGYLKDKSLIPELVRLSKDSKDKLRFPLLIARGMTGDKTALPMLVEALKEQDYKIRDAAANALENISDKTIIRNLIDALDSNHNIETIAYILGNLADEKAVPALERAYQRQNDLNDNWTLARGSILGALGKAGGLKAFPLLNDAIRDPNKKVRAAAAEAMGRMGDAKAVPALLKALKDDDEYVREAAAIALARLGDRTGIGILSMMLEDGRSSEAVLEALGVLGDSMVFYRSLSHNWVTADQVFNQIRKKLLFPENFDDLLNSPEQARRATGYYLLALKSRENGRYEEQLKNADLALSLIEPGEHTPLAIFSLWLKAQAELKLNRAVEALKTIGRAEDLFGYISYKNREDFKTPFAEYTMFLKGEILTALAENRQAISLYEGVLAALEKKRRDFNRPFEYEDADNVEKMAHTSLGNLYLRTGKEHLEKAAEMGRKS